MLSLIDREILKMELRLSLPSKMMLEVVNFGAIEVDGELIVLKNRYPKNYVFHPDSFIHYDEWHDMHHKYKEIEKKNVIFDKSLLRPRGLRAIEDAMKRKERKVVRIY
ncbi:hypothetical protein [Priestia megaterium]|uniref:hypothetical protein n=1 Tax=Priestia megaterium TaxID=1404 RepID=UPI000BFC43FF|nr:hypothetical protein [Priestia megaterium]PGO60609.1 hypothetical protein CN981_08655 [Priestia megaterium]